MMVVLRRNQQMSLSKLRIKREDREKKNFYCSDYNKPLLDLYFGFKGEKETNPMEWFTMARMGAGNGVEDAMVQVLKDSDIVAEDYNQKENGRVEIEREGIKITGYIDAMTKDGLPIEIKSINNKNSYDIKQYEYGNPKENYVGQLAIYMDGLGVDTGYLFAISVDGLNRFWFECKKIGDRKYQCKNVIIDLDRCYKRWSNLYKNNIEKDVQPDPNEIIYKIPVDEIDWKTVSKGDISKARNGHKVIGGKNSWRIAYSNWKDKIIGLQDAEIGYSPEELEIIREKTQGYTTW